MTTIYCMTQFMLAQNENIQVFCVGVSEFSSPYLIVLGNVNHMAIPHAIYTKTFGNFYTAKIEEDVLGIDLACDVKVLLYNLFLSYVILFQNERTIVTDLNTSTDSPETLSRISLNWT